MHRAFLLLLISGCTEYDLVPPDEIVPPGPGPELLVEPTAIDFGEVALDATASEVVTVTNVGGGTLELDPLLLADDTGSYSITALETLSLTSGASTDFAVTFAPHEPGLVEATTTVTSFAESDPTRAVDIQGTGGPRAIHDVDIMITADDAWDGWLDGVPITGNHQDLWSKYDELEYELESGDHVLAIHARDQSSVISGLISVVSIDGVQTLTSGDGTWQMSSTAPPTGWETLLFDDSAWLPAAVCSSQDTWGTYWPADFIAVGAEWVWWTPNCRDLQQAYFRLHITVP